MSSTIGISVFSKVIIKVKAGRKPLVDFHETGPKECPCCRLPGCHQTMKVTPSGTDYYTWRKSSSFTNLPTDCFPKTVQRDLTGLKGLDEMRHYLSLDPNNIILHKFTIGDPICGLCFYGLNIINNMYADYGFMRGNFCSLLLAKGRKPPAASIARMKLNGCGRAERGHKGVCKPCIARWAQALAAAPAAAPPAAPPALAADAPATVAVQQHHLVSPPPSPPAQPSAPRKAPLMLRMVDDARRAAKPVVLTSLARMGWAELATPTLGEAPPVFASEYDDLFDSFRREIKAAQARRDMEAAQARRETGAAETCREMEASQARHAQIAADLAMRAQAAAIVNSPRTVFLDVEDVEADFNSMIQSLN